MKVVTSDGLEDLMDDLAFTQGVVVEIDTLEKVLKVQDIDPAGVGARNLQECLSIQLERKETSVAVLMANKSSMKVLNFLKEALQENARQIRC